MEVQLRLKDLSPYITRKWYTQGRLSRKDTCREYANEKGHGHVFTFAITDDTQSMECVCFGQQAVKLAERIVKDHVYVFKNVHLKRRKIGYASAESPFNLVIQHNDHVTELSGAEAKACREGVQTEVHLLEFDEVIGAVRNGNQIDLLGVVVQLEEKTVLQSRSANLTHEKSSLLLEDGKGQQLRIVLWNDQVESATSLSEKCAAIILDVHGEMKDDGGLVLTAQASTTFHPADEYPEGTTLLTEHAALPVSTEKRLLTTAVQFDPAINVPVKLVSTVSLAVLNKVETDYFKVLAVVSGIPYPPNFYLRCPAPKCGAKLNKTGLGRLECSKCHQNTTNPGIGLTLVDYSGSAMVTAFNETAAVFAGCSLRDAKRAHETNSEQFVDQLRNRRFIHMEFRLAVSKNASDVFSGKCWAIRSLTERQFTLLLTAMQEKNAECIVEKSSLA